MFTTLLDWLPWVSGAGVAGYAVLWFLFPSFIPVIAEYLKALAPLVSGVARGAVEFVQALWFGLLDMLDNAKSVVFVVTVICLSAYGGYQYAWLKHEAIITDLHRDYTFVKKKTVSSVSRTKTRTISKPFDILDWLK